METYGAAGDTVEALLALDGDVGAIGRLQLDIEGSCVTKSNAVSFYTLLSSFPRVRFQLTLTRVIKVLADELFIRLSACFPVSPFPLHSHGSFASLLFLNSPIEILWGTGLHRWQLCLGR